jgi:ubiquinone/menaquinone biosynthesis C-methylase UbiE
MWSLVPRDGTGLEVGTGTGVNIDFYPPAAVIISSDVSFEMISEAKRKNPSGQFVVADAQALPFANGVFDWTAATLAFCEIPDPLKAFGELERSLKPDGSVILMEHVRPAGFLGILSDLLTTVTGPVLGEHFNRQTEALIGSAELRIVSSESLWRNIVMLFIAKRRKTPLFETSNDKSTFEGSGGIKGRDWRVAG